MDPVKVHTGEVGVNLVGVSLTVGGHIGTLSGTALPAKSRRHVRESPPSQYRTLATGRFGTRKAKVAIRVSQADGEFNRLQGVSAESNGRHLAQFVFVLSDSAHPADAHSQGREPKR